ncbi:MAG: hypothetical protein CVU18_17680 [Betaproteobacteria bacterium HGW-Betaproteobacteria-12]|nr:MAG: hypothetical protein CVU18_17680 [Betaproteobacteria bacterium HGW-Betaproteobacteria-12]
MECPNCLQEIAFFSRATHTSGQITTCHHCASPMRKELSIGRVIVFSFLIGAPLRLLGIFVPVLSFLDSLLTTVASIWLATILGARFRRIDPMLDGTAVAPGNASQQDQAPTRPAIQLPVPAIVVAWLLYGLLVWDGIARGYLGNLPVMAWDEVGQWIPSIRQLDAVGREWPKLHASLLVTTLPLLVLALLYADMSVGIARVVASGRRGMAVVILPLLGAALFFVGLDSRKLGNSFFSFALGSSVLFAGSAYLLVLGLRLAGQASSSPQPSAPAKSAAEIALESLQALTRSQAMPSTAIPPTATIQSAIRLLGRRHGIEEECRAALADLAASPPIISGQVLCTARHLLAISETSEHERH